MKKILFCLFVFILFFENAYSKSYRIGDKIDGEIEFYKKYVFELPAGNWVIADKFSYSYYGVTTKGYRLLKIKDKKVIEIFSIAELDIGARFQATFNSILNEIVFKNKYHGCYDRPEYFILEFFTKGTSHNCFWIKHIDVFKELNDPDDPELRGSNSQYKAWLRNNGIELPKVAIGSSHSYFSRLTGGKWFVIENFIDPQMIGAPKSNFVNKDRSEYHKYNISNYPEHKNIMDKIILIGAKRHKLFEKEVRAKDHHKLNLRSYISDNSVNDIRNEDQDILSQLNKLQGLLKSGVLTEDEFKKAKEKILN